MVSAEGAGCTRDVFAIGVAHGKRKRRGAGTRAAYNDRASAVRVSARVIGAHILRTAESS